MLSVKHVLQPGRRYTSCIKWNQRTDKVWTFLYSFIIFKPSLKTTWLHVRFSKFNTSFQTNVSLNNKQTQLDLLLSTLVCSQMWWYVMNLWSCTCFCVRLSLNWVGLPTAPDRSKVSKYRPHCSAFFISNRTVRSSFSLRLYHLDSLTY